MKFIFRDRFFDCSEKALIMGIHNATPDSFSDGGAYPDFESSLKHCLDMIDAGADIIDIGGESTRPGDTSFVSSEEELSRILPLMTALKKARPDSVISIDTMKAETAERALAEGADIINDVSGMKYSQNIAEVAAGYGAGLILMHMGGSPKSDVPLKPFSNVVDEVREELEKIADKALSSGIRKENIVLDPGLGGGSFGKTAEESISLISNIYEIKELGYPVLIGASRKGFLGKIAGEKVVSGRLYAGLGVAAWAFLNGADIIRTHDVRETSQMLITLETLKKHRRR